MGLVITVELYRNEKTKRVVFSVSRSGEIAISATVNYQIGPPNCLSMICTRVANDRFTPLLISSFFSSSFSSALPPRARAISLHNNY